MKRACVPLWASLAAFSAAAALGQDGGLTLESVLERARTASVAAVSARWRLEEARAHLRGSRPLRDNPVLEGAYGYRPDGSSPDDLELGLSQTFELGSRRGGRVRAAEAGVAREEALADQARARALRAAALSFLRGLAAGERGRFAEAAASHAEAVQRIAERRYALGDVAVLDVNLAAGALARARSEVLAAQADETLAAGELRVLLAMDPEAPVTFAGSLEPRPVAELAALLETVLSRGDLRAAEADLREAEALVQVGKGMRLPDVTPSIRYERDEGANVWWGGLTLTLPFWNRGQGERGVAEARTSRIEAELQALRRAVRTEVQAAYEAHRLRLAALQALRETAKRLEENATLARRSYDVGQIGLGELLVAQRETVEAARAHLERRLQAAEGEIELLDRAGVLR